MRYPQFSQALGPTRLFLAVGAPRSAKAHKETPS